MKRKQKSVKPLSPMDAKYIEDLFKEHGKEIRVTIVNVLGHENASLIEDAVGDLCLLMCEKIEKLKSHTSPVAWLTIASRFIALNLRRNQNKYNDLIPLDGVRIKSNGAEIFDEVQYAIWLEEDVPQKLMKMLTKRETDIYQKIYVEEKRVKDVAKELGITENTVRNLHKRLRDKIVNAINENKF